MLVSKILRKIAKGKNSECQFTVKGLLLDKVCATMHCSLSVQMKPNAVVDMYMYMFQYQDLTCVHMHIALIKTMLGGWTNTTYS